MNQYVTGAVIKELREKNHLTQAELADLLNVSDKTISKWETAKGYPDITLLEPIANVFRISVAELISGNTVNNVNVSANMMRSHFYVCPVCGNIIHSMGEAVISCHGITLTGKI
ncbi:MAG: helix-turn-helix domain-containing protein [Oliverpabstia sp.]